MLYAASAKSSHSREFNLELFAYLLLTLAINFYHLPYIISSRVAMPQMLFAPVVVSHSPPARPHTHTHTHILSVSTVIILIYSKDYHSCSFAT